MSHRAARTAPEHLRTRRCVVCGEAVARESTRDSSACPSCGVDLCERPPRTYAEMEGLDDPVSWRHETTNDRGDRAAGRDLACRLIERWLLSLFVAMLMLYAIAALANAAAGHS